MIISKTISPEIISNQKRHYIHEDIFMSYIDAKEYLKPLKFDKKENANM